MYVAGATDSACSLCHKSVLSHFLSLLLSPQHDTHICVVLELPKWFPILFFNISGKFSIALKFIEARSTNTLSFITSTGFCKVENQMPNQIYKMGKEYPFCNICNVSWSLIARKSILLALWACVWHYNLGIVVLGKGMMEDNWKGKNLEQIDQGFSGDIWQCPKAILYGSLLQPLTLPLCSCTPWDVWRRHENRTRPNAEPYVCTVEYCMNKHRHYCLDIFKTYVQTQINIKFCCD